MELAAESSTNINIMDASSGQALFVGSCVGLSTTAALPEPPLKLMEIGDSKFDLDGCLGRVKEGDEASAQELIQHLYPLVIKIVRRNLPKRDSEEDVAQEIFIKIFSSLHSFRNNAPLEHWVSRISVNTCMNRLRAERVRPEVRWSDLSETQAETIETVTAGKELHPDQELTARDMVDYLLETLSPEDRLIIRMLEMEELSVKEVSSRTGWSGTFIRVRAFRARQKLNSKFSKLRKRGQV